MSERVHATGPDGRKFTFKEWCNYLKEHENSAYEDYVGSDGKVFEIDGFRFNVHGVCRNPHRLMVGDMKTGYEVRTWRKWISLDDRRVVWWFQVYGYGANANGYGHIDPEGTEDDATITALQAASISIQGRIDWLEDAIKKEKIWGLDRNMGYEARLTRQKLAMALTKKAYDERCQLTLF